MHGWRPCIMSMGGTMSEESKMYRLNKLMKEFNVGMDTIVKFLASKGHILENPTQNTKVTEEQYNLLSKKYQSDKEVKELSSNLEIATQVKESVIEAHQQNKNPESDANEELVIKNFNAKTDRKAPKTEAKETKEEPKEEPEPATDPEQEFTPQTISASVPGSNGGHDAYSAEVKIIDKIDLDAINNKNRPDKKTKEEKEKATSPPAAGATTRTTASQGCTPTR